ncbi:MAG: nucleotide exchange factor GrpE [Terriglobia bacterium]
MEREKETTLPSESRAADDLESQEKQAATSEIAEGGTLASDLPAAYHRLQIEKQDLVDRLLRKQAELENFRKRMQREKEEFLQHATFDLIRALLPTLDGFERALQHRDADVPAQFYQGMELIYKGLMDVLERAGVKPVETQGRHFDPHVHQAVETVESATHHDQEIVEELQRGYKLKHRLIRPAIVKVAVRSHAESATAPSAGRVDKPQ